MDWTVHHLRELSYMYYSGYHRLQMCRNSLQIILHAVHRHQMAWVIWRAQICYQGQRHETL